MNPRFPTSPEPCGRALFLIGGERDQDDVELFQELWRQHHPQADACTSGPDNAFPGVAPRGGSIAVRASSLVQPLKPADVGSFDARTQAAKAALKRALAVQTTAVKP